MNKYEATFSISIDEYAPDNGRAYEFEFEAESMEDAKIVALKMIKKDLDDFLPWNIDKDNFECGGMRIIQIVDSFESDEQLDAMLSIMIEQAIENQD